MKDSLLNSTRDWVIVKGCGFLPFANNMCKIIGKTLSLKYSEKLLDDTKNLLQMHLKLFQKEEFRKQQKQNCW